MRMISINIYETEPGGAGLRSQKNKAGGLPVHNKFKACLGDLVRAYLKIKRKKRPIDIVHTCLVCVRLWVQFFTTLNFTNNWK